MASIPTYLPPLEVVSSRTPYPVSNILPHKVHITYGVIEDVLVKVKHLIFPTDVIVIDIEEDADIPLILGRPFMSTASCMVDMGKKIL